MDIERKKVIWAVDPFAKDKKIQLATFKALARITEGTDTAIEPVAVLSPDQLYLPQKLFDGSQNEYMLEAEATLKSWVRSLKHPRLIEPVLLVQNLRASHMTLDAILGYAKRSGAVLIGVGTYSKKGLSRFLLGSFAETLVLKSDIPTLVVNPKSTTATQKIRRVLFATDFSPLCEQAFDEVVNLARGLKARVVLYHKTEVPVAGAPFGMPYLQDHSMYYRAAKQQAEESGKAWLARARSNGVKADFVLEETPFYIPDGILKAAKKSRCQLVALASQAGPARAAFLGSIARQVVRMAAIPVWVVHTHPPISTSHQKTERQTSTTPETHQMEKR